MNVDTKSPKVGEDPKATEAFVRACWEHLTRDQRAEVLRSFASGEHHDAGDDEYERDESGRFAPKGVSDEPKPHTEGGAMASLVNAAQKSDGGFTYSALTATSRRRDSRSPSSKAESKSSTRRR
jgi:hypothetical protein